MDTQHYLTALRRSWWLVVAGVLVGILLGWGLSRLVTPVYTATSELFISLAQGNNAGELANGGTYTQNQMASYAEVVTAPITLDPVIASLDLRVSATTLASSIAVAIPKETTILQVAASDLSAERAARIANAVAASAGSAIVDLSPRTSAGVRNVTYRVITPAPIPPSPSSPKVLLNTALGLLAGLLASLCFVLLRARFDNRIRHKSDLVDAVDTAVLGSIINTSARGHASSLVLLETPLSAAAEKYRQLRADLQFVAVDRPCAVFVVTSSIPQEGKSTVLANLALALAEAGSRVLVIDADLRRPTIADVFGLEGAAGLSTVLSSRAQLGDVLQHWGDTRLDILTAGTVPPNPSELLIAQPMSDLIEKVVADYDVILIDSPPALSIADAAILAQRADGALVIADATKIRRPQLQHTIASLRSSGAVVLGTVLNRIEDDGSGAAYYHQHETDSEPS